MATTKWQFFNTRTAQWVDFPKRIMVTLEKHSTTFGSSKTCLIEHGDADYKIDFTEGKAVDTRNFHRWLDIRRIVVGNPSSPSDKPSVETMAPSISPREVVQAPTPPPHVIPSQQSPAMGADNSGDEACKLYGNTKSASAMEIMLLIKEGHVAHHYINVDLSKGEHLKPEFLALNPRHQIPVLVDSDGTIVWESNAIMRYICNTFSIDDSLYPLDTKLRARCEMALDWRQTALYPLIAKVAYPYLGFNEDFATANTAKPALFTELQLISSFWLNGSPFICGAQPSIADYSVVIPLLYLEAVNDFQVPESVVSYIHRFAAKCAHWNDVTEEISQFISSVSKH